MNLEKELKNIKKIVKKGVKKDKKKVKVLSLKRKHFKKELTTQYGFGYQDMKNKPKQLFNTLIGEGYDLHTEPVDGDNLAVDLYVVL